ncbi:MAG: hypothetical protein AAF530_22660 [Pseudomonadota bacterium]
MIYLAVLVRRLKPGKSYQDFLEVWYPDKGFGWKGRGPLIARNVADPREILTYAEFELADGADLDVELARIATQEAIRHERIGAVIEETTLRGIYEMTDSFDFSTDESVATGKPSTLRT